MYVAQGVKEKRATTATYLAFLLFRQLCAELRHSHLDRYGWRPLAGCLPVFKPLRDIRKKKKTLKTMVGRQYVQVPDPCRVEQFVDRETRQVLSYGRP